MQCGTCREAKSEQLPVSEVCRQCHEFSKWCQAVPNKHRYAVTLFLREYAESCYYVTTNPDNLWGHKNLATTIQMVDFEVPE